MNVAVKKMSLESKDISMKEVLRYMGVRGELSYLELQEQVDMLLPRFVHEINGRACYLQVPVSIHGDTVCMDVLTVKSRHLATALQGCEKAVLFAATLGGNVDRMYRSASVNSSISALIIDALGTTAVEALCDKLCMGFAVEFPEYTVRPRYSPGYGDLHLSTQRDVVRVLDTYKTIGVTLSGSLLMIPQKSVTAIVGLQKRSNNESKVVL